MLNSLFIDQRCLFGRVEAAMRGLSYVDIRYNRREREREREREIPAIHATCAHVGF